MCRRRRPSGPFVSGATFVLLVMAVALARPAELIRPPEFARANEIIVIGVGCGSERIRPEPPAPSHPEPVSQCDTVVGCIEVTKVLKDATGGVVVGDILTLRYPGNCWMNLPREFVGVDSTGDSLFGSTCVVSPGGWHEIGFGETFLLGLRPDGEGFAPGRGGFLLDPEWDSRIEEEIHFAAMGGVRD